MVEIIIKDQRKIIPSIALLEGEYGYHDLFLGGVPTILGGNGIESVIELHLTNEEQTALQHSAEAVKQVIAICQNIE